MALNYYKMAEDYASTVRIHCHNGDFMAAKSLCLDTDSPAASYYLAKQLEFKGAIPDSI